MESSKDVVVACFTRLWNERDLSIIDTVFSGDARIHSPMRTLHGKETMHEVVEKWLTAFPNLTMKWDEFVVEGNRVVCRFSADATHLGGFFDTKPTYKEVHFTGVVICRVVHQKIVDYWSLVDIHAILSQLEEYASLGEALES